MSAWALLSSLLCASTFAADPSGGWLSYARYKAPKPSDVITKLSATMVVPDTPSKSFGSPAFWFGVQTDQGDGALIQPIMAKWLGDGFYMFQEIFVRLPQALSEKASYHPPYPCTLHPQHDLDSYCVLPHTATSSRGRV